jgi:pimeloyl-ACP methyl ester carboxylesterase
MSTQQPQFLAVGNGQGRRRIAYLKAPGSTDKPGLVWLCGFKSEMTSTKAAALAAWAGAERMATTRFDYSGHGQSEGRFADGTISHWLEEARTVFSQLTSGQQILLGSSMGGYIALLLLRALLRVDPLGAQRIAALVLIAPAWDMTERIWSTLPSSARQELDEKGVYLRPSAYGDGPYPITRTLIEDGRRHLIGAEPFDPGRPVQILHGLQDPDVPYAHTLALVAHLSGDWTRVTAVADGEHRLSRPQDIALLLDIVGSLATQARSEVRVKPT